MPLHRKTFEQCNVIAGWINIFKWINIFFGHAYFWYSIILAVDLVKKTNWKYTHFHIRICNPCVFQNKITLHWNCGTVGQPWWLKQGWFYFHTSNHQIKKKIFIEKVIDFGAVCTHHLSFSFGKTYSKIEKKILHAEQTNATHTHIHTYIHKTIKIRHDMNNICQNEKSSEIETPN